MMSKRNRNIRSFDELEHYGAELEQEISAGNAEIKDAIINLKRHSPIKLANAFSKKELRQKTGKLEAVKGELIPELASSLLRRTLLRKSGFFNKWLISLAAKLVIKKTLKNTQANRPEFKKNQSENITVKNPASKIDAIQEKEKPGSAQTGKSFKREKVSLKGIWKVLKSSFASFGDHKVTKMSGSLAYYTVFSMGPLLIVIIALCGMFMEKDAAQGKVFDQLKGFLGSATALQLQDIIKNAGLGNKGTMAFIIGLGTLLIGATSIFADIQDSINTIWGIKPKPKKGWLKMLQNRFLSFSVIVSLGFLLLVSLGITAVLDGFSERLQSRFEDISVIAFYILNSAITLIVISSIFGVIFKVLPDANIKWRDVASGALVTAVLFMAGKFAISVYISKSDIGSTYGATGSLIILLLWTYYSSIILYFGAEFTKSYALAYGSEIHPNHYAVTIKEVEVEHTNKSVQAVDRIY